MQIEKVTLTDGTITIRPHNTDDVQPCFEAIRESMNELYPWMFWLHDAFTLDEERQWIESRPEAWEKGTAYSFAIIDSKDDYFVGSCGLSHVDNVHRFAEIEFWVRTSRARRGIATAATLLTAQFAFEELELNRVELLIATENKRSQRVAEKVGAMREGILRKRLVVRENIYDAVMFSLIRT